MTIFRYIPSGLFALVAALSLCHLGFAGGVPEELEKSKFFESKVRPLLVEHCISCHGSEKQEGGLRLDSESRFEVGGESGPVFDREGWQSSALISAIHYRDIEMPPSGKLTDSEIHVFEEWFESGAYWPQSVEIGSEKKSGNRTFTDADREYWFFQPLSLTADSDRVGNASEVVDSLIYEKLRLASLSFAEEANKVTLVRRLYLDLLGVVPTPSEASRFLRDDAPDAYGRLVDRLLDDPRYGERWGRFWLDLVRYSESDGYKQDDFRPTAYRYRDYVIQAFNSDKPYSDFVREQLAGDELSPDSLECRDASGYLRLWIYEYNQRDIEGQWNAILNDLTDVTGEAFLGLGYGCARCHDHKYDPLLQKDYFRLQAYFSGLIPREDLPAASSGEIRRFLADDQTWREAAQPFLDTIEEIERPVREKTRRSAIEKFPPEVRPALAKSAEDRSPREKQLAHLASLQQDRDVKEIKWEKVLSAEKAEKRRLAKEYLKHLPVPRSSALPIAMAASDVGASAAEVYIPGRAELGPIEPGIPTILNFEPMSVAKPEGIPSTGRRLALANWIVDTKNPMAWRVIVNRVWQQHFGSGLVANASDFGRLTEAPSHPELLDYLAMQFATSEGKFKSLHRWILNSRTYKQSAYPSSTARYSEMDPSNKWLWRFAPRRLDAEQIRDSILSASGEWDADGAKANRENGRLARSIYVRAMRNSQDRFLALFDAPDGVGSVAKRNATTTPLQSLMMMNSDWVRQRAGGMAVRIIQEHAKIEECIDDAYGRVFLRSPTEDEVARAMDFLGANDKSPSRDWQDRFADYCHVLISSNSFLYVE